ncbi:MAG TPA: SRPBCC family protein [Candidatus Eisenbacteria bacterium]|nr:SRPBCC family protein [Candidatus Eisenbacteria bacterium]
MTPTAVSVFRSYRTPLLESWSHLSRPDLLARWLGRADLDLGQGGDVLLEMWNGDVLRGRVLTVVPPVRIEFLWRSSALSPENHVSLRLEGDGPGSRLYVSHDGLRSEAERRGARAFWQEALSALRTVLHENRDAHEWGSDLPITLRAHMPRVAPDLWPLLSTASGLEKWVAHVEHFDGVQGGSFRLTSRFQGRQIVEEGRIEEIVPSSRVSLSWEWVGEGWGAPTRVEFMIEPESSGSAVLVLHSGFERIDASKRRTARRNYAGAWPEVLAGLKRLVAPIAV